MSPWFGPFRGIISHVTSILNRDQKYKTFVDVLCVSTFIKYMYSLRRQVRDYVALT